MKKEPVPYKASRNPGVQLQSNYPDNPTFRVYRPGYEVYFDMMHKGDHDRNAKILDALGHVVSTQPWLTVSMPERAQRDRITLALEDVSDKNRVGAQIVIGRWGIGHAFNIHGHAAGLTYERLLTGKAINRRFRIIGDGTVELESERIMFPGDTFVGIGDKPGATNYIHQFETIAASTTLHLLEEADKSALFQTWTVAEKEVSHV